MKTKNSPVMLVCDVDDCEHDLEILIEPADPSVGIWTAGIDDVTGCDLHYRYPLSQEQRVHLWDRICEEKRRREEG
jgi:hypothetical protein